MYWIDFIVSERQYPLLESIQSPEDVRRLQVEQLPQLAGEIRERIIEVVSKSGGHLTSNLGVTELTIALHRVFDFGNDRLLWDVGHQCYPHKLLTGRHHQFDTIRKDGGLSGFPNPDESEFDLFKVGHAGTAIPTALGMARADRLLKRDNHVVAVVGDASIVNGVAFEGLNQVGTLDRQMLIVLNDNKWGISPTQGAMADYLAKLRTSTIYDDFKRTVKQILPKLPLVGKPMFDVLAHLKEGIKATVAPPQIFEQMGLQYVGPIDGHDLDHLIDMLELLKNVQHPVLLHVHTVKGRGCDWAVADPGKFHSPKPFRFTREKVEIQKGSGKSWTNAFVESLMELARDDERIYAMTAGMPDGTGLSKYEEEFPDRYRDVGISESCTVDIAGGMAKAGLRPVCAIYSTFLQRAFDQVFQEVVLQKLPVMFCLDRAGLVGGDGAVHHGFLDIAYLRGFPQMVLMAPCDEIELQYALRFGLSLDQPSAIRYPRDNVPAPLPDCSPFVMGKSRRVREGDDLTILAYGTMTGFALEAAARLEVDGISAAVVNARFAKPIDRDMVRDAFESGNPVISVEDHSTAGGFGSAVLEAGQDMGLTCRSFARLGIPEEQFIEHGSRATQLALAGMDTEAIVHAARRLCEGTIERRSSQDKSRVRARSQSSAHSS